MKNVNLGQAFIDLVLDSVEMKDTMATHYAAKYMFRAIMSGAILVCGFLLYFALQAAFAVPGPTKIIGKFIACSSFSFCLIAIYYTKSELLTSNMMMTSIGVYYRKISVQQMFKVMGLCFLGNFLGGVIFAWLTVNSSMITSGEGRNMVAIMEHALSAKYAYVNNGAWMDLFVRAIFCNFLINLAMLMVLSGRIDSDVGKIIVIYFGVFMFMYLGLEHSVASTVLFTIALLYELASGVHVGFDATASALNVAVALIGNFIGGGVLVGVYYAFLNDTKT